MRLANVPPPMALYEIDLEFNIIDVAINVDHEITRAVWIVVLHHGGCSLYEWSLPSMMHQSPSRKWSVDPMESNPDPSSMYLQAVLVNGQSSEHFAVLLLHKEKTSAIFVLDGEGHVRRDLSSNNKVIEGLTASREESNMGFSITTDDDENTRDDELLEDMKAFNDQSGPKAALAPLTRRTKGATSHAFVPQTSTSPKDSFRNMLFTFMDNGSLFAGQRLLVRNCTSFLVTPVHLIYTTTQHFVKFVHLGQSPEGNSYDRDRDIGCAVLNVYCRS